jgi:uncharacterized protein (DUF302 family)
MIDPQNAPSYGLVRTLTCSFDEADQRIRKSLADQGFGVLTEIDLSGTMKKKLGHDMPRYTILGACHPPSAWQAVQADAAIGLLLPCNVTVTQADDGTVVLTAIDPDAMFQVTDADGIEAVAKDVRERLQAALANA